MTEQTLIDTLADQIVAITHSSYLNRSENQRLESIKIKEKVKAKLEAAIRAIINFEPKVGDQYEINAFKEEQLKIAGITLTEEKGKDV